MKSSNSPTRKSGVGKERKPTRHFEEKWKVKIRNGKEEEEEEEEVGGVNSHTATGR